MLKRIYLPARLANGRFITNNDPADALIRFRKYCRFEPETGCVVWTGGTSAGRGHHVRYGAFKYKGKRWASHRWSAKYIHHLDIDGLHSDHCCPHIPHPNTLCVEHVQAIDADLNRQLQEIRKLDAGRTAIHLQVGLLRYEDVYGEDLPPDPDMVPYFLPPAWLTGAEHGRPC